MALEITDANFKEFVNADKPFVIDFWAEWCGPCRMISPIVSELAETYKDQINIGKLNVDENNETTDEFGIRSIPTILFFKKGQLVDKIVGATSKEALEQKLKALLL